MLANFPITAHAGNLDPEVQLPGTARYALLDFIAEELPRWRDDADRPTKAGENALTSQLRAHLNSAARTSATWDWVQFGTEDQDEKDRRRTIDLTAKPCHLAVVIENRRYTKYNTLLPIECKRLPTPTEGRDRDEREYVVSGHNTAGGIQRFKFGLHGARHDLAAMIAYVQDETFAHWLAQVNHWIAALADESSSKWDRSDRLQEVTDDVATGLRTLRSCHQRDGLAELELRHLWIKMN